LSRRKSRAQRAHDAGPPERGTGVSRAAGGRDCGRRAAGGLGVAVLLAVGLATAALGVRMPRAAPAPPAPSLRSGPKPWMPAGMDSMRAWSLEARSLFEASTSDTVGPGEAQAFLLLDRVTRRYFSALGAGGMNGAQGVLELYEELGVDAEFAQDDLLPEFCAVTFFNPKFPERAAMTYLYWWRGSEL